MRTEQVLIELDISAIEKYVIIIIYSPELLRKLNSNQSSKVQRDVPKNCFDYVFGVPGINKIIKLKL